MYARATPTELSVVVPSPTLHRPIHKPSTPVISANADLDRGGDPKNGDRRVGRKFGPVAQLSAVSSVVVRTPTKQLAHRPERTGVAPTDMKGDRIGEAWYGIS